MFKFHIHSSEQNMMRLKKMFKTVTFLLEFLENIVPIPLVGGGRNYILKWVFFVQSILADRYIHRREMWVVSLKSWSSIEFKIKKIFLIFFFFQELSRIEVLCEHGTFDHF